MSKESRTCFECDQPADHDHHVIPRSLGGTRTVPLCHGCHGKVHGLDFTDHGLLITAGLQRVKVEGRVLGRPCVGADIEAKVVALKFEGWGMQAIAKELGIGNGSVQRIIREAMGYDRH